MKIIIEDTTFDAYEIVTFQKDDIVYDFYKSDNNEYFMTREQIGKALGYKNPTKAIESIHMKYKNELNNHSYLIKSRLKQIDEYTNKVGVIQNRIFYTTQGIMLIIQYSRMSQSRKSNLVQIIKQIINKDICVIDERKELSFISTLEDFLSVYHIKGVSQFQVDDKYRVDYYIPDLHIAIEYDENNHKYYNKSDEKHREKYIKNKLKCQVFRVVDSDNNVKNLGKLVKDFVVTGVLKRIYEYSLESETEVIA